MNDTRPPQRGKRHALWTKLNEAEQALVDYRDAKGKRVEEAELMANVVRTLKSSVYGLR